MTMTMQSKDRPAVPSRACGQPCHALKSLIWKNPIRPWSGHGDGGSDCRPFCKLGLGQTNTGPFQPASVWPVARPTELEGLILTHSTGGWCRICLRETCCECPTPPSTKPQARPETGSAGPTASDGQWPPLVTHMGPTCLSQRASLCPSPPAADHSDVRDEGLHVRQLLLTNHRPLLRFPFAFGHLCCHT